VEGGANNNYYLFTYLNRYLSKRVLKGKVGSQEQSTISLYITMKVL
jgi:hypothetical protein